jgi:Tripartite tricarboxylate transporter TctB family
MIVASDAPGPQADEAPRGVIKAPQDFAAGLFLLVFAAIAAFGAFDLRFGQLRGIGPGLMPKVMAAMLATFGGLLIFQSFLTRGSLLERWSIRGPFFVLGAVLLFAATIRGVEFSSLGIKIPAFGLLVAGPLAVVFSGLADKDTRWGELIIYACVITGLCIGLFKFALRLPIPLAPWWLGY